MKNKVIGYIKITFPLVIWPVLIGFLLIFFPNFTAKYLCGNNINYDEVVKNGLNKYVGTALFIFSFFIIVIGFFLNRNLCIIKIDGFRGCFIPDQSIIKLGRAKTQNYTIDLKKQTKEELQDKLSDLIHRYTFYNEDKKNYCMYCFYGTSYVPFLFKLGTLYSDHKKYSLYHMSRPNLGETKRVQQKKKHFYKSHQLTKVFNSGENSDELVVRFFTTFEPDELSDSVLSKFDCLTIFDDTTKGSDFDHLKNRSMINDYARQFVEEVREYYSKNKYKTIHFLLATSSEMVFYLGTIMNQSYDGKIIVYHYNGQEKCYSWGIKMYESEDKAIYIPKRNK